MKLTNVLIILYCVIVLVSCENPIAMKTIVHEDGSLDKTISLEKTHKFRSATNMFGITEERGWQVTITPLNDSARDDDQKFKIEFSKSFPAAENANAELDHESDSLFKIHTSFEKKFRWFYTYITYKETFKPINRFHYVDPDDYFNQEDHSFIDRLPGEGTSISKADSIFLESLNKKISEHFVNMGILEEQVVILKQVIERNELDKKWLDTIEHNKELIWNIIDKDKGDNNLAEKIADTLKIPLKQPKASQDFEELSKDFNARLSFMSFANDGQYVNAVEMPWTISYSNADSVYNNTLVWRPLSTKFAFKNYTMVAEARKLNIWAVAVSAIFLLGAVYFGFRRR